MAIQLFVPSFDIEACLDEMRVCLEKGWTGMGFKTAEFENAWKQYTGLPYAHFLNSATAGLHLAVEIMREQYGWSLQDEIITTPLTFVSTNHAIVQGGMKPVFADVDETLCLDPEDVKQKITSKTRAVMFVGIGGNTGALDEILQLCKEHDLKLILDAAHMAGTRLHGQTPGKDADAVIYSFQAVKNLPTGDSGMLCFADEEMDAIARKKSWLGISKDTYARSRNPGGAYKWEYDVEYTGYKYNGNALTAALGLVQLRRLDADNAYRRQIAEWYESGFASYDTTIGLVPIAENCISSRHLFQIVVDKRNQLLDYLNQQDIFPGVHYTDNTRYRMYSYAQGTCPKASYFSEHLLSLPIHLRLTQEDVDTVIRAITDFTARN